MCIQPCDFSMRTEHIGHCLVFSRIHFQLCSDRLTSFLIHWKTSEQEAGLWSPVVVRWILMNSSVGTDGL